MCAYSLIANYKIAFFYLLRRMSLKQKLYDCFTFYLFIYFESYNLKVNDIELSIVCLGHFKETVKKLTASTSPANALIPEKHSSCNVRGLYVKRYRKKKLFFLEFFFLREFSPCV